MSSNSFFNPKPKNNFVTPMKELFNSVNETIEEKSTKLPNINAKVSQLFNNNTGNKTNYITQNPVGSANSNNTQPNSNTLNNQSVFPKQQKASDKFNELSKQAFGQNNTRATSVSSALNPFLKRDGTLVNEHIDHQRLLNNPRISERTRSNLARIFGVTQPQLVQTQNQVQPSQSNIVAAAKKYMGTPYVWAGDSPDDGGLDCSGFVYNALKDSGHDVQRTEAELYRRQGEKIDKSNLQEGDLVFFGSNNYATHIGIYLGNGQIIHSSGGSENTRSNPGKGVSITDLNSRNDFIEGRRY